MEIRSAIKKKLKKSYEQIKYDSYKAKVAVKYCYLASSTPEDPFQRFNISDTKLSEDGTHRGLKLTDTFYQDHRRVPISVHKKMCDHLI